MKINRTFAGILILNIFIIVKVMKIYEFVKNNKATYKKDEICFIEIIHTSRMAI